MDKTWQWTEQNGNYRLKMFYKHESYAGRRKAENFRFLSMVTLTFDLDLQIHPSEGPNASSL